MINSKKELPNIVIGEAYDSRYAAADIHYDRLENLADFFGRSMPVHFHDRFFQIHIILQGKVHLTLDESSYQLNGPICFFTPPAVPHAFASEPGVSGHVLTIRQDFVWQLIGSQQNALGIDQSSSAMCIDLHPERHYHHARLLSVLNLFSQEWENNKQNRSQVLEIMLSLVLQDVLSERSGNVIPGRESTRDLLLFNSFNRLVEEKFRMHVSLCEYADSLGITEGKLNSISRRFSGLPSKRLIFDRLLCEAKRLLLFTNTPVTAVGYELGFKDPAYFSRFFRKETGSTAVQFRANNGNWPA